MAFDRFRKARDEVGQLDLLPVMNLMVVLIPFLMLGAAFYHLGVIPTSLPTKVDVVPDKPPSDDIVTLNLLIEPERLVVSASSATLDEPTLRTLRREWRAPAGAYPLPDLQAHLVAVKTQYPKSDTLVVFPEASIAYQTLVDVLDTTRERVVGEKGGEPVHEPVFPVTVFSKPPIPDFDAPADGGVPSAPADPAPPEEAP